jgi:hypothetical protein
MHMSQLAADPKKTPAVPPPERRLGVTWLLSALLCAGAIFLWIRGHTTADTVVWRRGHVVPGGVDWERVEYMGRSLHGRVVLWRTGRVMSGEEMGDDPPAVHAILAKEPAFHYWENEIRVFRRDWPAPMNGARGWVGLRWQDAVGDGTSGKLGIPMWMPVAVTAVLPGMRLRRYLRDRRERAAAGKSATA